MIEETVTSIAKKSKIKNQGGASIVKFFSLLLLYKIFFFSARCIFLVVTDFSLLFGTIYYSTSINQTINQSLHRTPNG